LKSLAESLSNVKISYALANVTNKEDVQAVVDLAMKKYGLFFMTVAVIEILIRPTKQFR
jgi:hypothetical protein